MQASLLPNGNVEFQFGQRIEPWHGCRRRSRPDVPVAVRTLDLSAARTAQRGAAAIGERSPRTIDLDLVATARKFYETHPDNYDQLVLWTDVRRHGRRVCVRDHVANEIRGIGLDVFDQSRAFGSAAAGCAAWS